MKAWLRRIVLLLAVIALATGPFGGITGSVYVVAAPSKATATYTSPEKIQFISYSKHWNQQKLKALYNELLKNLHGEELKYLGKVILSPEDDEDVLGVADLYYNWTKSNMSDLVMDGKTEITLFGADTNRTVESMAATLSHEYGHHFTYYWMIKKERKLPSNPNTKWASIRGLKGFPVVYGEEVDEDEYSHYWDPAEIMADDYMALFGSPTAKKAMADSLKTGGDGFYAQIENEELTPAVTMTALRDYWLQLSGIKDPKLPVLKEPKLQKIEAVRNKNGGYDHKLTFSAASTNSTIAKRLQYIVYWEDEEYLDYSSLTTGKTTITVSGGLPESELTIRVYAYDPTTKQFVYARPVEYNLSNPARPAKAA